MQYIMNRRVRAFNIVAAIMMMVLPLTLVACDDDDDYYRPGRPEWAEGGDNGSAGGEQQTQLVATWQGVINGYYAEVWQLEGDNYATVCEFMADGNGRQLDYDRHSPRTDYAYTPFTWMQTRDAITIAYATDSGLSAMRISDFALTDAEFTGRMVYGDKAFTFDFVRVSQFDWSPYTDGGRPEAGTRMGLMHSGDVNVVRCGAFAGR